MMRSKKSTRAITITPMKKKILLLRNPMSFIAYGRSSMNER